MLKHFKVFHSCTWVANAYCFLNGEPTPLSYVWKTRQHFVELNHDMHVVSTTTMLTNKHTIKNSWCPKKWDKVSALQNESTSTPANYCRLSEVPFSNTQYIYIHLGYIVHCYVCHSASFFQIDSKYWMFLGCGHPQQICKNLTSDKWSQSCSLATACQRSRWSTVKVSATIKPQFL